MGGSDAGSSSAGSAKAPGKPASASTGTAIPAATICSRWSKNCARFSRFLIDSEGLSAVGPSHAASTWLPGAASAQGDGDAAGAEAYGGVADGFSGLLWVMIRVNERRAIMATFIRMAAGGGPTSSIRSAGQCSGRLSLWSVCFGSKPVTAISGEKWTR